jgi:1-acyl-sn-glycerol-3-phosphate acyltransferase
MNKVGGYPLKKGSRSIIETLRHSAELLRDSRNMVLIFPQGEINSHYADTFHFERGIEHIMRQAGGGIQIILLANLIDYFSKEKPSLYMYFKDYNYTDTDAGSIEKEYNSFYSACLEEQRRRSET